jgi:hypothetical protein
MFCMYGQIGIRRAGGEGIGAVPLRQNRAEAEIEEEIDRLVDVVADETDSNWWDRCKSCPTA